MDAVACGHLNGFPSASAYRECSRADCVLQCSLQFINRTLDAFSLRNLLDSDKNWELPVVAEIKEEKFYQTHTDGGVRRRRHEIEHTPFSIQIRIKFRAHVIGVRLAVVARVCRLAGGFF